VKKIIAKAPILFRRHHFTIIHYCSATQAWGSR